MFVYVSGINIVHDSKLLSLWTGLDIESIFIHSAQGNFDVDFDVKISTNRLLFR